MVVWQALFAIVAITMFALAGLNVAGKRFHPLGFGLAASALVIFLPALDRVF